MRQLSRFLTSSASSLPSSRSPRLCAVAFNHVYTLSGLARMQLSRFVTSSASSIPLSEPPRLRVVAFNDVYKLSGLARLQTFLKSLNPAPDAIVLAGDFLSPSPLSALDNGKGAAATIRAVGITHVCLGNHEADLRLPHLYKRLEELSRVPESRAAKRKRKKTKGRKPLGAMILNSNVGQISLTNPESSSSQKDILEPLNRITHPYDVVETSCGRVKVAMMGLLSDEPGIFRDNTFRGLTIHDITTTLQQVHDHVKQHQEADWILPLTHQTLQRDEQFAKALMELQPGDNLILGGHEHSMYDITVPNDSENSTGSTRILKAGSDCQTVHLIDLTFQAKNDSNDQVKLDAMKVELVNMNDYEPSVIVQEIINSHKSLLTALKNEEVLDAESLLPPGTILSSEGTRYQQTSVGGIFCTAIKEELNTDVAIINGASIKGNKTYKGTTMTYAQLKRELPFPTKMIVVPMTRGELHNAIYYSRTQNPSDEDTHAIGIVERKGYLQVDVELDRMEIDSGDVNDELLVALPRNLLKGFCHIQPLVDVGKRLEENGCFPAEDDYVPAADLVVRHSSKEKWYELVHGDYSFTDLDVDQKGYLTRDDVARLLRKATNRDPSEFVLTDMMAAVDEDENGVISPGEFSHLLAIMEREHNLIRFD